MTSRKRSRGRPAGTGIDDSKRLIAMALEIAANPGMRPTTAIKALGITDQSTIRRVRDKYRKACRNGAIGDLIDRKPKENRPTTATKSPRLRPANDDLRSELSSAATLQHYALALQSSVIAVQHRISASVTPTEDLALRDLLNQQYHLSSVLLGLIAEAGIAPTHRH